MSIKVGGALVTAALAVGGVVTAGTALAAPQPLMSHDWNPQFSPQDASNAYWKAPRGAKVQMFCWTGGPWQLGTGKWFKIRANASGQPTGYVPANAVWPQVPTPHC